MRLAAVAQRGNTHGIGGGSQPKGPVVEVLARGVVLSSLGKYRKHDYVCISVSLGTEDRIKAVRYALRCQQQRYSVSGLLFLIAAMLVRDSFRIPDFGQQGCATLISRALECGGMSFARRAVEMTPADLAKHFKAEPPADLPGRRSEVSK